MMYVCEQAVGFSCHVAPKRLFLGNDATQDEERQYFSGGIVDTKQVLGTTSQAGQRMSNQRSTTKGYKH